MSHVIVRSDESNARLTALALAGRGNTVALCQKAGVVRYEGTVEVFGERSDIRLVEPSDVFAAPDFAAVVFAEGEDVASNMTEVLVERMPRLLVIVGGGISGIAATARAARTAGLDPSRIVMTGGFAFGGTLGTVPAVTSEKNGLLSAFLADPAPDALELFASLFPAAGVVPLRVAGLSSNNALIHVPAMLLNAMSVERADPIRFYVEAYGQAVCRLAESLDAERLTLGPVLGVELPAFEAILDRYYAAEGMAGSDLHEKITTFPEYGTLLMPTSFEHRYLVHEVQSTFAPLLAMLEREGLPHESTAAAVRLAEVLVGRSLRDSASADADEFLTL